MCVYLRCCAAILIGRIKRLARPSVCLSVRPSRTSSWLENETGYKKTRIGVNVLRGRSNRCAKFQLKRWKVGQGTAALYVGTGPTVVFLLCLMLCCGRTERRQLRLMMRWPLTSASVEMPPSTLCCRFRANRSTSPRRLRETPQAPTTTPQTPRTLAADGEFSVLHQQYRSRSMFITELDSTRRQRMPPPSNRCAWEWDSHGNGHCHWRCSFGASETGTSRV